MLKRTKGRNIEQSKWSTLTKNYICQVLSRLGWVCVSFNQSIWLYPFSKGTLAQVAGFLATVCSWIFLTKSPVPPNATGLDSSLDSFGEDLSVTLKDKKSTLPCLLEALFLGTSFHRRLLLWHCCHLRIHLLCECHQHQTQASLSPVLGQQVS